MGGNTFSSKHPERMLRPPASEAKTGFTKVMCYKEPTTNKNIAEQKINHLINNKKAQPQKSLSLYLEFQLTEKRRKMERGTKTPSYYVAYFR